MSVTEAEHKLCEAVHEYRVMARHQLRALTTARRVIVVACVGLSSENFGCVDKRQVLECLSLRVYRCIL
jgi:nucleoside-diphosphate-sugar epimerase